MHYARDAAFLSPRLQTRRSVPTSLPWTQIASSHRTLNDPVAGSLCPQTGMKFLRGDCFPRKRMSVLSRPSRRSRPTGAQSSYYTMWKAGRQKRSGAYSKFPKAIRESSFTVRAPKFGAHLNGTSMEKRRFEGEAHG